MIDYSTKWHEIHPNVSQTTLFRDIVPVDPVDFGNHFHQNNLNQLFVGDRLRTGAGFNCNHLYRDIRTEADIIIYSDATCTVIQPLGEPGRDIDSSKIGHFMVMSHTDDGPVTFNEMLPSTFSEVDDLGQKIATVKMAVQNLRSNIAISECGAKVVAKAQRMGVPLTTGIQEFFQMQITGMDESVRTGPPGYKLLNDSGKEIGTSEEQVTEEIRNVFGAVAAECLIPRLFIQGPNRNTQILSHIHCFILEDGSELPSAVDENYMDVEVILEIKREFMDDVPLIRTRTPPPPIEEDVGLSRQESVFTGV